MTVDLRRSSDELAGLFVSYAHAMKSRRYAVALLVLLSISPDCADANIGIPMLAFAWPLQWLALLPVIAIEAAIVARKLGIPYRRLLWPTAKANLVSTFIGIPIAWVAMVVLAHLVWGGLFVTLPENVLDSRALQYLVFPLTAAWLGPNSSDWDIYAAFVILAIPFCAASIWIERLSLANSLPRADAATLKSSVRVANVVSYALLIVGALAYPLLGDFGT